MTQLTIWINVYLGNPKQISVTSPELTSPSPQHYPVPMAKTALHFLTISLAALLLTGCGGNFLVGKWTIDQERTVAELSPDGEPAQDAEGLLKAIGQGLQKGLAQILLSQFKGTVLEFTPTELRKTRDGVGTTVEYEILERPTTSSYIVKYADGEITTWQKVEGGIRMKFSGGQKDHWVYFTPVAE